jgi:hypothetical protein
MANPPITPDRPKDFLWLAHAGLLSASLAGGAFFLPGFLSTPIFKFTNRAHIYFCSRKFRELLARGANNQVGGEKASSPEL